MPQESRPLRPLLRSIGETATSLTKVDSIPNVSLIVTNSSGDVLCVLSGDNGPLAQVISMAAKLPGYPLTKQETLMALGQDCYSVSREFMLSVCGTFLSRSWADIQALSNLPSGAKYTIVVTM